MTIFAKKSMFKKSMLVVLMGTSLLLAACNDDKDDNNQPPVSEYSKNYIGETAFKKVDGTAIDSLENAASIEVMRYYMPSVLDKKVEATALIMIPKTPMPKDGWRVVVWEHGTIGNGDQCAQSRNAFNPRMKAMSEALLKDGYVILAVDYEGSGSKGTHPYLNVKSEALSAIHAVNAFKDGYGAKVNGAWMSVGQSQGGNASIGTAEYANDDPNFKGAVAGAPASSLGYIIEKVAPIGIGQLEQLDISKGTAIKDRTSVAVYATLLSYGALAGEGILAYKPDFDYGLLFEDESKRAARLAHGENGDDGLCLAPLTQEYINDITAFMEADHTRKVMDFPGINHKEMNSNPVIKDFLAAVSQPGLKPISKPLLVIQGKADSNVPLIVTQGLVKSIQAKNPDNKKIEIIEVDGAGHTEAIDWKRAELVAFIKKHMPNPAS